MFEQPNGQQPATPAPKPEAAAPQQAATGTPPAGATLNDEAVKAYLATNPGVLNTLTTKLKVNGKEVEVPYSELPSHAQKGLASTQTWEEAARLKQEAEQLKAQLAAQGDPVKRFAEEYVARTAPQAPPSPLSAISDPNDIVINPSLALNVMQKQERELAELRTRLDQLGQTQDGKVAEVAAKAEKQLKQYREYIDYRDQFDAARKADPTFTATVTGMDDNGAPVIDYGDNPYVSAIAVSLKYGAPDAPSAVLGGKSARSMPLSQVIAAVRADNAKRVKDADAAEAARIERERSQAVGGVSAPAAAGATFALPPELRPSKDDTPAQATAKIRQIEEIIHSRARNAGVKYEIPQT